MGFLMLLVCMVLIGLGVKRFDSFDGRGGRSCRAVAATILMLLQAMFLSVLVMATYNTFYCEEPVDWDRWVVEWVVIGLKAGILTLVSMVSWLRLFAIIFVRRQEDIPGPGPLLVYLLLGISVGIPASAVFCVAIICE